MAFSESLPTPSPLPPPRSAVISGKSSIDVCVQVSLLASLDPEEHLKIGTALKTLAEEQDVLVVCSGQVW